MLPPMAELAGLGGSVCSVVAIWMQWNLQYRLSHLEDRYKDGRITNAQLERGMRWARLSPIFFTLLGACLLFGAAGQLIG